MNFEQFTAYTTFNYRMAGRKNTHEPGIFANAGNSGRVALKAPPKQSARNLKGYKNNALKRDSDNKEMSDSQKFVEDGTSLYEKYWDWITDNFIPGESEKYSIWCFIMGALGCILCFIPFYRSDPSMMSGGILPGQLVFDGATTNLEYSLDRYHSTFLHLFYIQSISILS